MRDPWQEIALDDYEKHMSLPEVRQLQTLNQILQRQLARFPVSSVILLGVAGGNGLEHVDTVKYRRVWGVDINPDYLAEVRRRYGDLDGRLECLCLDLRAEAQRLPRAGLLTADLLIEYIGYEAFRQALSAAAPTYVSCVIQIDEPGSWVSDSPYLHAFDRLDEVHCAVDGEELTACLRQAGYRLLEQEDHPLPNRKRLRRLDYQRED
ncbi:MAG: class I SAM-dependent methyltransferase [Firmicutes bacterium]|nr:class I SAM-dependent methyltransferase [Bacillota bacterium]